jgi:hypothetical protein
MGLLFFILIIVGLLGAILGAAGALAAFEEGWVLGGILGGLVSILGVGLFIWSMVVVDNMDQRDKTKAVKDFGVACVSRGGKVTNDFSIAKPTVCVYPNGKIETYQDGE